jgi:UDP-N-acetylmuramate: L-alanyl-gamma-D-glutamyl-meso-diaminopimelate ligase
MHVHILGICGTFMGGIAQLAVALGHRVTGCDANVYPPMSTQLESAGIKLFEGYDVSQFNQQPDVVVIGNALSRGNPAVEYVLEKGLAYTSGPQWLAEHVLQQRWVLAIAGTHGKTSTASMLAWILEHNNLSPGFLIGGVPANFAKSARLGETPFFVVEADEYDTAFFDKRSKFVHYRPRTLIMNNLEFDHADIFKDLSAIQTQFHHLVRTVPGNGLIIYPDNETALIEVLAMGCWSEQQTIGRNADWSVEMLKQDGSEFNLTFRQSPTVTINWDLLGVHNVSNAVAAIAAAHHVGVSIEHAAESLAQFKGIKRRLEMRGKPNGIAVYDDFAHHPTAISTTLQGLREHVTEGRIIAVLEPRSNTMRMGVHSSVLADSLTSADKVFIFEPENLSWSLKDSLKSIADRTVITRQTSTMIDQIAMESRAGDHIVIMSNGGFENIHQRLIDAIETHKSR